MFDDGAPPWAWVIGVIVVAMVLSTLAVGMRIYTRLYITKTFGLDDWFLLATQTICMTGCVVYCYVESNKYNYHPRSQELFEALSAPFLSCLLTYLLSSITLKISLAIFFLRLAQSRLQRSIITLTASAQLIIFTAILLVNMLRCGAIHPVDILTRIDCPIRPSQLQPVDWVMMISTAAFDWVFAIIPIVLVARSRGMSTRSRAAAVCLIVLAIIGSTVSLVRLPYIKDLEYGPGFFENETTIAVLCLLEVVIGTIAFALATTKPLWLIWGRKVMACVGAKGGRSKEGSLEVKPVRPLPPISIFNPSVRYDGIDLDMEALKDIGVLPDADVESHCSRLDRALRFLNTSYKEGDSTSSKKVLMTSIFEVEDDVGETRRCRR
ncbi:hypothetical protein MBLNU457_1994t1 [Dothideomycetes sp. NU457]